MIQVPDDLHVVYGAAADGRGRLRLEVARHDSVGVCPGRPIRCTAVCSILSDALQGAQRPATFVAWRLSTMQRRSRRLGRHASPLHDSRACQAGT